MHVERNVAASLVSTLLHCGKSKDGLAARNDLEDMGIRPELHPKIQGKRTYLPPAPWSCIWLKQRIRSFAGVFLTSKGQMDIVLTYQEVFHYKGPL